MRLRSASVPKTSRRSQTQSPRPAPAAGPSTHNADGAESASRPPEDRGFGNKVITVDGIERLSPEGELGAIAHCGRHIEGADDELFHRCARQRVELDIRALQLGHE